MGERGSHGPPRRPRISEAETTSVGSQRLEELGGHVRPPTSCMCCPAGCTSRWTTARRATSRLATSSPSHLAMTPGRFETRSAPPSTSAAQPTTRSRVHAWGTRRTYPRRSGGRGIPGHAAGIDVERGSEPALHEALCEAKARPQNPPAPRRPKLAPDPALPATVRQPSQ